MGIKESLGEFKHQLMAVSKRFDRSGILDITRIKEFEQEAMALDRTVDRLISKADAMIKNLLEALALDSRL